MLTMNKISFDELFSIGIHKPGHVYKILIKLEMDIGFISESLVKFIQGNCNTSLYSNTSNTTNTVELRMSREKSILCGDFIHFTRKTDTRKLSKNLTEFLMNLRLQNFKENFSHNGFERLDYIYLQMFSSYPITKEVLKNDFHIYDEQVGVRILTQLKRGKLFDI